MDNLIFWSICGFYSFYFTGILIGLSKQNLKTAAVIGCLIGFIRGFTGKSIFELFK
jgi:hypothetical protein